MTSGVSFFFLMQGNYESCTITAMSKKQADIHEKQEIPSLSQEAGGFVSDEDEDFSSREEVRTSLNSRISYVCRLVALIIAIMVFATTVIGQYDVTFVILGLSFAVALLALAGLQNHQKPKR